jgi:hypothetical protein
MNRKMRCVCVCMSAVAVILASCGAPTTNPTATSVPPQPTSTKVPPPPTPTLIPTEIAAVPDQIVIEHRNLFPEGIEFDEGDQRFLISSVTQGTIHRVAGDGTLEPFIEDEELQMSTGIEIDRLHNRLLVANTSHSEDQAMLGAYDLETGQRIFMVNLSDLYPGADHVANDVAVDTNGIAYVTDTYVPVIYRVDMEGQVSRLIVDGILIYINGIIAHPDGYLILGAYPNLLLKIPIKEPEIAQIKLADDIEFDTTDGIILRPDGSLIMVTFPDSIIYQLDSDDNWASAGRVAVSKGHYLGWGTTVTLRDESAYLICSHLDRWMSGLDQNTFQIVRVEFEEY